MNEIYNYLFNNLRKLENRQDRLAKAINKCCKSNRQLNTMMFVAGITMLIQEMRLNEHRDCIEILNRKIKELEAKLDENKEV